MAELGYNEHPSDAENRGFHQEATMTKRAFVFLSFALVFSAVPTRAQGPGGPPPNYPDLVSQIADLQARIAKLEGHITMPDLAGTYTALITDTNMDGFKAGAQAAAITTRTYRLTITLNADGTGAVSDASCAGSRLTLVGGALTGVNCAENGGNGLEWTYADGVATITFLSDGDQIPLNVALGGRLLTTAVSPFHDTDPSSNHLMFILTRLR